MKHELGEKTERLVAMLIREKIDAVLLNAQHNFAWLTRGGSNAIDISRENGAATLLITRQGKGYVMANNIEMPRMLAEEVSPDYFSPVEFGWRDEKSDAGLILKRARKIVGENSRIGADLAFFAAAVTIENKIAACRCRLTDDETDRYRSLGRDAGNAARRTIDKIVQGETEIEIAEKLRHELASDGMTSVVTLVAADQRISQFRHPVPTGKRWNKTLLLVTCAKRDGLIASLSRMVCIGEVPEDLKRKTGAAAYVNACLLAATRAGTTGAELYRTAEKAYADQGFPGEINLHHQGGAAGYKTREWVAHPQSTEVVQTNQAFAWNPSITGTKIEETCIAGEYGVEIITASTDFPSISTIVRGREYHSPGILSL